VAISHRGRKGVEKKSKKKGKGKKPNEKKHGWYPDPYLSGVVWGGRDGKEAASGYAGEDPVTGLKVDCCQNLKNTR